MHGCDFVLRLGLGERDCCLVVILTRQRAFLEELLAAVVDLLLGVVVFLGGLQVVFRLLPFFGQGRSRLDLVGGFCLMERAFGVGLSGGETVIVGGSYGLPDKTKVKVAEAPAAAPEKPGAAGKKD